MAALSKTQKAERRVHFSVWAGIAMSVGGGIAWGFGGVLFGGGLFILLICICEDLQEK